MKIEENLLAKSLDDIRLPLLSRNAIHALSYKELELLHMGGTKEEIDKLSGISLKPKEISLPD
jgi:hypothetical protein